MGLVIYGLKNCDTCRKALKALPEAELKDVRVDGVPKEVLAAALAKFGDALVNTRSTTWRGLSEQERKASPEALLAAYPALMKRPLASVSGVIFLGWNKDIEAEIKASL
jgi:arsenate reductase